ncbi:hypothetical protein LV75_002551 [Actinokineospora diospyrosa]|uniref:Uncharacterized protein n=1 Tax=Actinokineospora diospyrosa TaxID=103728 RepID=A0ABT1IBP2_9PSEU|nr:hypothetical protein [Actinokineospora diospyrosa]
MRKIICPKSPRYTAYRGNPTKPGQRSQPVDNRARCGQPPTLGLLVPGPPRRAVGTGGSAERGAGDAVGAGRLGCPARLVQDHLPQEPLIYSLPREPDKPGAAIGACGQQNTLWTNTSPAQPGPLDTRKPRCNPSPPSRPCQPSPWTLRPCGANWPSVRSALAHLADHRTLGPDGASPPPPPDPPPTHLPSPWTVGTAGAIPAHPRQPCQPCQPSTWTVGVAGAKCSMGRTCFALGDGTRSVSARQGLLLGPCFAVLRRVL